MNLLKAFHFRVTSQLDSRFVRYDSVRDVHSIVDRIPIVDPFRRHCFHEPLEQSLVVAFNCILALLLLLQTRRTFAWRSTVALRS